MPSARIVSLRRNYRSNAAGARLRQCRYQRTRASSTRKTCIPLRQGSDKPAYVRVEDTDDEVDYIVGQILEARESHTPLRRQAVLFRSAHHSDRLELELTRRNIPLR